MLVIADSGYAFAPSTTSMVWLSGVLVSDCGRTVTVLVTFSVEPSGYVTTTVTCCCPGFEVSTGFSSARVVPSGRSASLVSTSSGVTAWPLSTVMSAPFGSVVSESGRTVTFTGTVSTLPSG